MTEPRFNSLPSRPAGDDDCGCLLKVESGRFRVLLMSRTWNLVIVFRVLEYAQSLAKAAGFPWKR